MSSTNCAYMWSPRAVVQWFRNVEHWNGSFNISECCPNFIILTKFQNFNQISECLPNFIIFDQIHNFNQTVPSLSDWHRCEAVCIRFSVHLMDDFCEERERVRPQAGIKWGDVWSAKPPNMFCQGKHWRWKSSKTWNFPAIWESEIGTPRMEKHKNMILTNLKNSKHNLELTFLRLSSWDSPLQRREGACTRWYIKSVSKTSTSLSSEQQEEYQHW